MNVYLWDAGRWCGVAASDRAALAAATACLTAGGASVGTARVEAATVAFDKHLQPAYARLGNGWTATVRDDGTRMWEAFGGMPDAHEDGQTAPATARQALAGPSCTDRPE